MALTYDGWLARNPLAEWIKEAKARGRRSALTVARHIGVSKQAVYYWLNGSRLPGQKIVAALQDFTGITEEQWLKWWKVRPRKSGQKGATHVGSH